ncbi:nmrA-like family domain-containing protein 1 [Saccostrea echinata]|uniref:nmrA-like family domain-containing protein 1 n=1 Tax=Saccostrea echinata TaxID=191078 RepID=UPI002A82787C|nr:nmrA-like family domain-containing protein 1 [Saccostrea echinata]
MSKIVAVFGANCALGAAVARSLAKDSNFMVKAVDPDGSGQYSSEIRASGAQVVQCNLEDVGSISQALSGCECAFVTTVSNFNNPDFMDDEIRQGMNIADACAKSKVSHVVFNTGLHTIKIIGIGARHLVAKAEVEAYMKGKGVPLTSLMVPTLYDDLLDILKPLPAGQNNRWLAIPMGITPLDMISVDDVGDIVRVILNNRTGHLHKTHSVCGDKQTIKEMAQIMSRHLAPLYFQDKQVTIHEYQQLNAQFPWSQDYANMFDFYLRVDQRFNVDATQRLSSSLRIKCFQEWVQANSGKLKKAFS